jgi:hypothetical protein
VTENIKPEILQGPTAAFQNAVSPDAGADKTREISAPMLDVHAPHEPIHTWKGFFIHIATICVGLLIAVGLEQSVEAVHRSYERKHLRESLQHESEQILTDTVQVETAVSNEIHWLQQMDLVLKGAAAGSGAIGPLPPIPNDDFNVPDNPVFKAAKASNKFALLSQQEAEAYGEMNGLLDRIFIAYTHREDAIRSILGTQRILRSGQSISASSRPGTFDTALRGYSTLVGLTPAQDELKQMQRNTVELEIGSEEFRYWSRQARGAASVMVRGERNLHEIETAERQFNSLP